MDAQLLFRAKIREMEREAERVRLVAAAKEARNGPVTAKAARGCPSMPLRLLRRAS